MWGKIVLFIIGGIIGLIIVHLALIVVEHIIKRCERIRLIMINNQETDANNNNKFSHKNSKTMIIKNSDSHKV